MIKSIPYRISRIETLQFAIFPDLFINGQDVMVKANSGYNVRSDNHQVRNIISVNYTQNEKLLLTVQIACYFDIDSPAFNTLKQEGTIPVDFLRYMGSISVGTLRGIIHAKTEGTVLNPIVLPPINLDVIINKDLVLPGS